MMYHSPSICLFSVVAVLGGLPGQTDFALSPGSLAVDTGVALAGSVDTDILGRVRPQDGDESGGAEWDRGALELPDPAAPTPPAAPRALRFVP